MNSKAPRDCSSATAIRRPPAIRFEPGHLVIEHSDVEDLVAKLFLLSQAAANDLDLLAETAENPPLKKSAGAAVA